MTKCDVIPAMSKYIPRFMFPYHFRMARHCGNCNFDLSPLNSAARIKQHRERGWEYNKTKQRMECVQFHIEYRFMPIYERERK